MSLLKLWNWPGNVRELGNLVERMVNLCEGLEICSEVLSIEMIHRLTTSNTLTLISLRENERQRVLHVVSRQNGHLNQSTQLLGISRTALFNKLKIWQINVAPYRL